MGDKSCNCTDRTPYEVFCCGREQHNFWGQLFNCYRKQSRWFLYLHIPQINSKLIWKIIEELNVLSYKCYSIQYLLSTRFPDKLLNMAAFKCFPTSFPPQKAANMIFGKCQSNYITLFLKHLAFCGF